MIILRLSELQSKKIVDITSGSNVGNIIDVLISDEGKIDALIIDVRGDSGGYLTTVDSILKMFMTKKQVVYQLKKGSTVSKTYGEAKIDALIIDYGKSFFSLNRESDTRIEWKQIIKIGEDVILIKKD